MCKLCHKSFIEHLLKVADEFVALKKIKFASTTFTERMKEIENIMRSSEFEEYAKKRIPEIVKETPVFKVVEYEDGKIKNITYE